jgi:tetratricopeptide (TPR) repeat protein
MLKPKKKITKKELKQDTLITSYMKVTGFYDTNKRWINYGAIALVVIVVGTAVFLKGRATDNELATTKLAVIHQFYDNGQYQAAIDGAPERGLVGLKSIADQYGSTHAGDLARFYLADSYYQLGKFAEALEAFKEYSPSDDLLKASRYAGIAACSEALGNYTDAGKYFEDAAGSEQTDNSIAEDLSNAARCFAQGGDKSRALDILKRIKKNYPTTTAGREADRFITQLSV